MRRRDGNSLTRARVEGTFTSVGSCRATEHIGDTPPACGRALSQVNPGCGNPPRSRRQVLEVPAGTRRRPQNLPQLAGDARRTSSLGQGQHHADAITPLEPSGLLDDSTEEDEVAAATCGKRSGEEGRAVDAPDNRDLTSRPADSRKRRAGSPPDGHPVAARLPPESGSPADRPSSTHQTSDDDQDHTQGDGQQVVFGPPRLDVAQCGAQPARHQGQHVH